MARQLAHPIIAGLPHQTRDEQPCRACGTMAEMIAHGAVIGASVRSDAQADT